MSFLALENAINVNLFHFISVFVFVLSLCLFGWNGSFRFCVSVSMKHRHEHSIQRRICMFRIKCKLAHIIRLDACTGLHAINYTHIHCAVCNVFEIQSIWITEWVCFLHRILITNTLRVGFGLVTSICSFLVTAHTCVLRRTLWWWCSFLFI